MKARSRITNEAIFFELEGKIDYESQDAVRVVLETALTHSKSKRIVINCENMEFVGSMGISTLISTLKQIQEQWDIQPEYVNVRSEFQKLMKAMSAPSTFNIVSNPDRKKPVYNQ